MQVQTSLGTSNYSFAITQDGKLGTLISLDPGTMASGNCKLQYPKKIGSLDGGFAVSLSGMDLGGGRVGALALLYFFHPVFCCGPRLFHHLSAGLQP